MAEIFGTSILAHGLLPSELDFGTRIFVLPRDILQSYRVPFQTTPLTSQRFTALHSPSLAATQSQVYSASTPSSQRFTALFYLATHRSHVKTLLDKCRQIAAKVAIAARSAQLFVIVMHSHHKGALMHASNTKR